MEASQIIDFAGWSMAGVSMVGILGNAIGSVDRVVVYFISLSESMSRIAGFFETLADITDKIVFWN